MTTTATLPAPGPVASPSTSHQRWVDLGLVILIAIAPLVVSAVYHLFVPIAGTRETTNLRFITGLIHESGALVLMTCLVWRQGRSLRSIGLSYRWLDIPVSLGLLVTQWIGLYLVYAVISWIHLFWTGTYLHVRDPRIIFANPSVFLWIPYLIAAPIFEETIVRAYLMTELIGLSWPVWLTIIVSAGLQTAYHLYYGVAGAISVGAGFLIASIYFAKSRRLVPIILAHLLWDIAASIGLFHR